MKQQPHIRVLVVDDSAVVRRLLSLSLSSFSDVEVVGTARDAYEARDEIVRLRPDVVTLDIEMPRMDGLAFLEKLMRHLPTPVVMVTSMAPENSANALRALQLGAVDVVRKVHSSASLPDVDGSLIRAIRTAAVSRPEAHPTHTLPERPRPQRARAAGRVRADPSMASQRRHDRTIVGIGCSTGGVRGLEEVISALPATAPGVVVVQHMPKGFVPRLAQRLDRMSAVRVDVARTGRPVEPGTVYLCPGGRHLTVEESNGKYVMHVQSGPLVNHHRPSVDVLFESLAKVVGAHGVAALLTGMGEDGARGMLAMRDVGAHTIAESEDTCVVFGMPRAAIEMGAAERVVRLDHVAGAVMLGVKARHPRSRASASSCLLRPA